MLFSDFLKSLKEVSSDERVAWILNDQKGSWPSVLWDDQFYSDSTRDAALPHSYLDRLFEVMALLPYLLEPDVTQIFSPFSYQFRKLVNFDNKQQITRLLQHRPDGRLNVFYQKTMFAFLKGVGLQLTNNDVVDIFNDADDDVKVFLAKEYGVVFVSEDSHTQEALLPSEAEVLGAEQVPVPAPVPVPVPVPVPAQVVLKPSIPPVAKAPRYAERYDKFWKAGHTELENAKAVFANYVSPFGGIGLWFFPSLLVSFAGLVLTCHWNRSGRNREAVEQVLKNPVDSNGAPIQTVEQLLGVLTGKLGTFQSANKGGSFFRRVAFVAEKCKVPFDPLATSTAVPPTCGLGQGST